MTTKQTPENRERDRLLEHAAKLRELNDRLVAIGRGLLGTTAESLEQIHERLLQKLGPEVCKEIYDSIPETRSDENTSPRDNGDDNRKELSSDTSKSKTDQGTKG